MTGDGALVMTPSREGAVVWDTTTGNVTELTGRLGFGDVFDLSEDGGWGFLKTYSRELRDGQAAVWNLETGELHFEVSAAGDIIGAGFSPDATRLFTAKRKNARLWNVETGELLTSIKGNQGWPGNGREASFEFHSNSRSMVYGSGNRARVYSSDSGEPLSGWFTHEDEILDVQLSGDGGYLLTASFDQTAKLWHIGTGQQMIPDLNHDWLIGSVGFGSEDSQIVTGSWDKNARLWDRDSGLPLAEPFVHPEMVLSLDMHPSGQWLATGAADGVGRIWELPMPDTPGPDWFLDVVEQIAGYRVTETGNTERIVNQARRLEMREQFQHVDHDAPTDAFTGWARWFFADRGQRAISPFSDVSMEVHRERLLKIDTVYPADSLKTLLRHNPMDWRTLSRMAHKLSIPESHDQALDPERADWLTRLAVRLAPDKALCWWARAEALLALNRYEDARRAVQRSLALEPSDPNALFIKALILQETGSSTDAYEAFKFAVLSAHERPGGRETENRAYLMGILQLIASTDLSDKEHLERWVRFSANIETENSRVSQVTEWLQALAGERPLVRNETSGPD
jgi:hypothetical protein